MSNCEMYLPQERQSLEQLGKFPSLSFPKARGESVLVESEMFLRPHHLPATHGSYDLRYIAFQEHSYIHTSITRTSRLMESLCARPERVQYFFYILFVIKKCAFLPSIFIAHRAQQSHCSSIFHRVLLTHALALSASQFVHKKKSPRICTSMHSGGFKLTKLAYTRRG